MTYRRVLRSPGVALRLVTNDAVIADKLEERLGPHMIDERAGGERGAGSKGGGTPTERIDGLADAELILDAAHIADARWDADLCGSLDGERLLIEQSGGLGEFHLRARRGRLAVASHIEYFHNYIENALRMILVELAERVGMRICHTAALAEPGTRDAWLFHGPSGSGKTTSTEMALGAGWLPINDDLAFIGIDGDQVVAQGCAFHGRTRIRDFAHGRFPIAGIFRLVQSERHQATPLARADAVRELCRALVAWRPRTKAEQEALFDFALGVCSRVPSFRLEFKKDPLFLEAARDGLR